MKTVPLQQKSELECLCLPPPASLDCGFHRAIMPPPGVSGMYATYMFGNIYKQSRYEALTANLK